MPPPPGLINLSAAQLIAEAGGDPWTINDELQAGDPGAINDQADAFHSAAGCVAEIENDFVSAKQRFEQGWQHNGAGHPITESPEVTRATTTLHLQKPQLAKIAVDLETVAAALATAQRTCDADIAALDTFLHGADDAIGAAKAANQDTQALHDAAVATVRITLGEVQSCRDGYASTMASAESSIATIKSEAPLVIGGGAEGGAHPPAEGSGPTVTKGDIAIGAAGAIAGGTAEGVRQTTLKLINESPGTGPGKADPGLLKWLEDPTIGGVELKGFSRLGGVVAAASAVPRRHVRHPRRQLCGRSRDPRIRRYRRRALGGCSGRRFPCGRRCRRSDRFGRTGCGNIGWRGCGSRRGSGRCLIGIQGSRIGVGSGCRSGR